MRLLAEHLLEHGYKRIAILCHGPPGHATADARLRAAREVLQERGVPVPAECIAWTDSTLRDAYRQAMHFLGRARPRAIMATNDWTAMAVLRAARDAGLHVPEDVAVTGFDDLPLAPYLEPPLTTVVFSGFDLGREAMRRMIEYVETAQPPPRASLPVRLVIRRSCGCPHPEPGLEGRACAPAPAQDTEIVQDPSTSST
jgi:DNA-binding LacI/PurR family transcriptional regulator